MNISVFPLEDISKVYLPQKCLLPSYNKKSHYNGRLARCELLLAGESRFGYAVCQIYEPISLNSLNDSAAYLDGTVTIGIDHQKWSQQLLGATLCRVEPLEEVSVDEIDVTFVINMDFFGRTKKPHLRDLEEIAKIFLQAYCLTDKCIVRCQALLRFGIVGLKIKANIKDNLYFNITDGTRIRIFDVRLDAPTMPKLNHYHTFGFETALEELNEVLHRHERGLSLGSSNALLIGPVGCGKSATIAYFTQQNNCNCFHISMKTIMGQYPGEAELKVRNIFAAAEIFVKSLKPRAPTILLFEDLHLICTISKAGSKDTSNSLRLCAQINALLDSVNKQKLDLHCLATATDIKILHKSLLLPGRFQYEIPIDPPNNAMRKRLFQLLCSDSLPQHSLSEQILDNVVAQTSGYVIADLEMLVRSIENAYLHNKTSEITLLIIAALAKSKPTSIRSSDVSVLKSEAGFDSIGGMQSLKNTLRLNVLTGLTRSSAFRRFGISLPKGILLYGPPGCAKTTIAKCLASEAKMTFIATSSAEVYSPYVGCAEKYVTKIFDTARKHAPCLIFLDEIDTLVGCRALGMQNNDVQMRILSTLLTEMDGIMQTRLASEAYILVVAATNRPNMIDDALLRPGRFDQLIHVPAPDLCSRASILKLQREHMPFADDVNILDIAERTNNFSGADICNLCNEAAMYALQKDLNALEISKEDFDVVFRSQKPSLSQEQIDSYYKFKKGQSR